MVLCYAIQDGAMLCHAIQDGAMLCYAMQLTIDFHQCYAVLQFRLAQHSNTSSQVCNLIAHIIRL